MKFAPCFVLLAAMGFGGNAAAIVVTPSVTGTITQVVPSGNAQKVTVNGRVFIVDGNTRSDIAISQLHTGQPVTLLISKDGKTVLMVHDANAAAVHETGRGA